MAVSPFEGAIGENSSVRLKARFREFQHLGHARAGKAEGQGEKGLPHGQGEGLRDEAATLGLVEIFPAAIAVIKANAIRPTGFHGGPSKIRSHYPFIVAKHGCAALNIGSHFMYSEIVYPIDHYCLSVDERLYPSISCTGRNNRNTLRHYTSLYLALM